MHRSIAAMLVMLSACGVGTYRTAEVRGQMEIRLVVREGQRGEDVSRWFSDEIVSLEPEVLVDASHVSEVQLENLPDESRHIVLYLDEIGTQRLAEVTERNPGRRLAIVIDGRVVVAPTIRTPIADGVAHITVGQDGDVEEVFDALTRRPE
jgi:preprotein translocase subunit SecD